MSPNPGAVPPDVETLAPGTQVGRWRVVERLGVGGQGAVYRVEDLDHPGDFYALKLALRVRDGRTEREGVMMMGPVAHPNVVRFHGCARWPHPREGVLGLVMEWVPGQALDVWAETEGTSFRRLANVGATVARTLGELHGRGVLHRDLKPEHIRIRETDGQPVLLDFGAGWYEGAVPLTTGPLPPTTVYLLSPEAVRALWRSPTRLGARHAFQPTGDLYALGVCLYRATTGHYPFSEWLSSDLLQWAIVHARPMAPRRVNPRVPRALSDIIVRLLSKDPRERYASGTALHAALSAAADAEEAVWDASIFEWEEVPSTREGESSERYLAVPPRPRLSWSRPFLPSGEGLRRASRCLMLAATTLLMLIPGTREPSGPPDAPEREWTTGGRVDPSPVPNEEAPVPGSHQKLAPCTQGLEVEVSGACWHSLVKQQPPDCPGQTIAYKGQCLWPVPKFRTVPTSVDGGAPEAQ